MKGLLDLDLVFVTGKGGVGKTTVAAALAQLAGRRGNRVLVCEMDRSDALTTQLEADPVGFTPREVTPGVFAMTMDTEASLREYLKLQLRVPIVGKIGGLARALDFVATAAPGVRDILAIGKLCYEVRERHYDVVIVDAPASGHVVGLLSAPQAINELVKVGPIRDQTDWMVEILRDPGRTGAVIVTTPEEMPVEETLELAGRLSRETVVPLSAVVVNRVLPELFGTREEAVFEWLLAPDRVAKISESVGGDVSLLFAGARLAVDLRRTRAEHLERLQAGLDRSVPVLLVPYLFARSEGLRATNQLATFLEEELGT